MGAGEKICSADDWTTALLNKLPGQLTHYFKQPRKKKLVHLSKEDYDFCLINRIMTDRGQLVVSVSIGK